MKSVHYQRAPVSSDLDMPPKELSLEEEFETLRKDGKNTVDGLLKMMKDAMIVTDKAAEEAARKLMTAGDDGKVTLEKLKEAMNKVAVDTNKTAEEVKNKMRQAIAAALGAVAAAAGTAAAAVQPGK